MSRPAKYCDLGANWFTGCEPGLPCWERCWARAMANRLKGRYGYPADEPFRPTFHEAALAKPLPRKPKVIAANFMGDWALATAGEVFEMVVAMDLPGRAHTFLTLTKRPGLLATKLRCFSSLAPNIWLGTSASTQAELDERLPALLAIPAAHYWLSLEPLLGPVDLGDALSQCSIEDDGSTPPWVNWVVVGCESGRRARWGQPHMRYHPADGLVSDILDVADWTYSTVIQCRAAGVPVWVKQLPVFRDGRWRVSDDPADFPEDLRVQERPF